MRTLILGAAGQVGRALAATAPAAAQVVAFGRDACDIGDADAVRLAIADTRPQVVFNAAAYTNVDLAEQEPARTARLNAAAPGLIAEACAAAGARMVHLSTDYVFDGKQAHPYTPAAATNPLSVYGRTKRDGESAVFAALPNSLVVRTSWVYAATGRNFVLTMIRLMDERERLAVVADQIGTPTYASSLAAALWQLVAVEASGVLHFTDAGVASWYDFAIAVQEEAFALGLISRSPSIMPIATADYPTPARRPLYSLLDKRDTWAAIGGPPSHWRVNLRACLREISARG